MIITKCFKMHKVLSSQELYEEKINKTSDILRRLKDGYVKFIYFKEDGDKRVAFGTLKDEFVDKNFEPSGVPEDDPSRNGEQAAEEMGFIKYFDLVKNGWRMFKVSNDVYFKEFYETLDDVEEAYPALKGKFRKYSVPKDEKEDTKNTEKEETDK